MRATYRAPSFRHLCGPVLALAIGMATLAASGAEQPFFSGPSVAKVSESVTFAGKSFAPGSAVTVFVKGPDGVSAGYSAVTGSDGGLKYTLVLRQGGTYTVTVADSGGRTLATAVVVALP